MSHYRSEWDVSQLSSHGEHQLSFSLTLSIHYPPETCNMFWTQTALWLERALRSWSSVAVLKWMNESVKGWMKEWSGWMNSGGREGCGVMRYLLGTAQPVLFFLPLPFLLIGWEESMLLEGTAVMWGLLPSLSQPLQFMNESWKNWMKNWFACERVVCALPVWLQWENLSCFGFMNAFLMHAIYT